MTYRLDTNAFSDLMREHPAVDARLAGLGEADTVVLCPVVRGEILYDWEDWPRANGGRSWKPRRSRFSPASPVSRCGNPPATTTRT